MKKGLVSSLIIILLAVDFSFAGPFWWLRPRNWGRRNTTTYTYNYSSQQVAEVPPNTGMNVEIIKAMHEMDCEYRNNHGLNSLILHSKLCEVAQAHAENMARNYNMDHYLGGAPWNRAFAAGWPNSASENIARGYYSVSAAYAGWFSSRGHRLNMLGSHTYCGFGCATATNGTVFWAAMYSD